MNIIYIGDKFYFGSGTIMSCIYTEDGTRMDWAIVERVLRDGHVVNIRPATVAELSAYEEKLDRLNASLQDMPE